MQAARRKAKKAAQAEAQRKAEVTAQEEAQRKARDNFPNNDDIKKYLNDVYAKCDTNSEKCSFVL